MSISIGRLGSVGVGIETTPGTPVAADVYLPYTENSVREMHEPIEVTSSNASRAMDIDSVGGKKWGEGDIAINADIHNSGYLWLLALGNEITTAGTPNNHEFYATFSGNTPKTATLIYTRGISNDVRRFSYSAIDELTFEVEDGLATMTASFMTKFPDTTSAQTPTTTSGTVLAFKDYFVQFGSTLTEAAAAATTPINDFSLTISNNLEVVHRSGSQQVSFIKNKGLRVTGNYTIFFEDSDVRDYYGNLNKRAMILTASGNNNESLRIRIPRFSYRDAEIEAGLDDFYTISSEWTAEDIVDSGARLVDVRLQNDKSTAY